MVPVKEDANIRTFVKSIFGRPEKTEPLHLFWGYTMIIVAFFDIFSVLGGAWANSEAVKSY